jgi:hypothetical protein
MKEKTNRLLSEHSSRLLPYASRKFWPKSQHCNGYRCSRSCFWRSPDRSPHATTSSRLRKRPAKPPRTGPRPALRPELPPARLELLARRPPVTPGQPVAPERPVRLALAPARPGRVPARRPARERAGQLRRRSKAWKWFRLVLDGRGIPPGPARLRLFKTPPAQISDPRETLGRIRRRSVVPAQGEADGRPCL